MAKKKKGKPKRVQKAHEEEEKWHSEEEGDWDDYKTFEEWHRESMRRMAEEDSRGGRPRRIVEEEGQQLYVLLLGEGGWGSPRTINNENRR